MRFLESQNNKAGGAIFVGGGLKLKGLDKEEKKIILPWLNTPINFDKVKNKSNKFVALFSDNDPYVKIENSKILKEKLGAKIIIEKNKGHYIEDVTKEVPVVLKELLKLAK